MKAFVVLAAVLATAAAEADPALLYSGYGYHGLGYAGLGYTGLGYSGLAHTAYAAPLAYAHHGVYAPAGIKGPNYANDAVSAAGYAHKGQYVANSAGVVYVATTYAHAPVAVAVGKSAPCVNAANVPVPCAAGAVGYHGLVHHAYGKRSAEADPALVYSGLGYAGLGYAGLGYHGLGYAGLPYATTYAGVHSSHVGLCLNYA